VYSTNGVAIVGTADIDGIATPVTVAHFADLTASMISALCRAG